MYIGMILVQAWFTLGSDWLSVAIATIPAGVQLMLLYFMHSNRPYRPQAQNPTLSFQRGGMSFMPKPSLFVARALINNGRFFC